jgi:hypothetical protein
LPQWQSYPSSSLRDRPLPHKALDNTVIIDWLNSMVGGIEFQRPWILSWEKKEGKKLKLQKVQIDLLVAHA